MIVADRFDVLKLSDHVRIGTSEADEVHSSHRLAVDLEKLSDLSAAVSALAVGEEENGTSALALVEASELEGLDRRGECSSEVGAPVHGLGIGSEKRNGVNIRDRDVNPGIRREHDDRDGNWDTSGLLLSTESKHVLFEGLAEFSPRRRDSISH
jgi:hypothetical protein